MSGVINAILEFLSSGWLYLLIGVGGLVILWLVVRILVAVSRPQISPVRTPKPVEPTPSSPGPSYHRPQSPNSSVRLDPDGSAYERTRFQEIIEDLREDNEELRDRVRTLTQLNAVLGPLVKELNSNVDRRRLGPIVIRVLCRLFEPKQALVFIAEEDDPDTLTLVAQEGMDRMPHGFRVQVGDGFVGLAAKKKVLMVKEDLERESNLVRQQIEDSESRGFTAEIAAPILFRGSCLGVLCMGGLDSVKPEISALLSMISDMVSLSLMNYLQYRKIQEFANTDSLTRLFNKGYFLELCDVEFAAAEREDRPMSILMIDLDHFKHYNDSHGHLAGDALLMSLAEILKKMVRENDVVARFGGEEFIILLTDVAEDEAMQAAERIRAAIAEHEFLHRETQPLGCISASVGVASMPTHGYGTLDLIGQADDALYAAKDQGRNRVVLAAMGEEIESFQ